MNDIEGFEYIVLIYMYIYIYLFTLEKVSRNSTFSANTSGKAAKGLPSTKLRKLNPLIIESYLMDDNV